MDRIGSMGSQTAAATRMSSSASVIGARVFRSVLSPVLLFLIVFMGVGVASSDPVSDPSGSCSRHADCSDGNVCNGLEICREGICASGKRLECTPRNACVLSICDPRVGCKERLLAGGSCDDGNACTTGDVCEDGRCVGGTALICKDEGPCVFGICDRESGCSTKVAQDGSLCDDGRKETKNDRCQSGQCRGEGVDPLILEQMEDDRLFDLQMDPDYDPS
jgi:hypothetical protein